MDIDYARNFQGQSLVSWGLIVKQNWLEVTVSLKKSTYENNILGEMRKKIIGGNELQYDTTPQPSLVPKSCWEEPLGY